MAKYPDTVYPWYLIDIVGFWTINLFIVFVLKPDFTPLLRVSFLDVLLYGLAVYRIANITSNEEVTKVLRAPFVDWKKKESGEIEEIPKEGGFKGFMGSLLYCSSCTGLWWAAILGLAYLYYPSEVRVIFIIFALSGLERFFTGLIGMIFKRA